MNRNQSNAKVEAMCLCEENSQTHAYGRKIRIIEKNMIAACEGYCLVNVMHLQMKENVRWRRRKA